MRKGRERPSVRIARIAYIMNKSQYIQWSFATLEMAAPIHEGFLTLVKMAIALGPRLDSYLHPRSGSGPHEKQKLRYVDVNAVTPLDTELALQLTWLIVLVEQSEASRKACMGRSRH